MEDLEGTSCHMELIFERKWKHIPIVRVFVENYLAANLPRESSTNPERVAMALSELMENAVKYADRDAVKVTIAMIEVPAFRLRASVENGASAESIGRVRAVFDRVMGGKPLETYVEMMREAATRDDGTSRLGLIRIRAESGCALSLETTENSLRFCLDL